MNPLVYLLGLLGAFFAHNGLSSDSASTTEVGAATPPSDGMSPPGGGMGMPGSGSDDDDDDDDGMDMPGGGDHMDHGMPPPSSGGDTDITAFGSFEHSSSHTMGDSLEGGRTPITTEAMEMYNGLRAFLGLDSVQMETVGQWAFDNMLTNNDMPYGDDLNGVGLYYAMQGAKVGWISDDSFDPQLIADIQRTARLGSKDDVMDMVRANAHDGFAEYLESEGLTDTFVNTLKMEPHYGGWMHGRTHGFLEFDDESGKQVAIAHDLNHLTVLSHDQTQPFMNDTFDWPQWPALDAPEEDVIDYFQSMVILGDPHGDGIELTSPDEDDWTPGEELMASLALEVDPDEPDSMPSEAPAEEELVLI